MSACHDPARAALLRERTLEAIADLRRLCGVDGCIDPAAAGAMQALRLAVQTLECWWLPVLDELAASPRRER